MFILQKTIVVLLMPLCTSAVLAILALVAALLRRKRLAVVAVACSIAWTLLWSLPVMSKTLRLPLENHAPAKSVSELPSADVIIVLGGGIVGAVSPWRPYPDMLSAADRMWHAARLYHAGKAPRILLSGGEVFSTRAGDEASAMAALLKDFGVPDSAMILEKRSRTTSENADESAKLMKSLGFHRALLVTSALHMPRALIAFRNRGVEVIPASTDVEVFPSPPHLMDWVPDVHALDGSDRALHELAGIARCRMLGC